MKADHLSIVEEYKKYGPPYYSEYTFSLSVVFVDYPGLDSGAFLNTQVLKVKDLCAGMIITPAEKPPFSDMTGYGNFIIDNLLASAELGEEEIAPW